MFKKRIAKSGNGSASTVKRKLDISDPGSEPESDLNVSSLISNNSNIKSSFKKRKNFSTGATTRKPNKEVVHTDDGASTEKGDLTGANSALVDVETKDQAAIITAGSLKPIPKNIKTTTITDFQPDVCKDFLQTGYCGYGDTCKFLHIRDESRRTKAIEREWETVASGHSPPSVSLNNDTQGAKKVPLPFKCVLCKDDYKFPVKTQCGHIFCKACFMDRYKAKKKSACFICGHETNGIVLPVSKSSLAKLIE
ncbi:GNAT family acetyltransferase with 2 zinc fingers [Scheffersomyces xylosifermentans]|uniref:GNAT family acetyltransferase with 2 zinc fingers n=1 Tax=Scheffersomyces xylosifermentans TaxID=1304137 RepID=UPI00315C80BE